MWKIRRIWWFLQFSPTSRIQISDLPTFNFILHILLHLFVWTLWPLGATWQEIFQVKTSKGRKPRNYIVIWYILSLSSLNLWELIFVHRVSLSRRNVKWRKSEHFIHEANWIWRLSYKAVFWILGAYHRARKCWGFFSYQKKNLSFSIQPQISKESLDYCFNLFKKETSKAQVPGCMRRNQGFTRNSWTMLVHYGLWWIVAFGHHPLGGAWVTDPTQIQIYRRWLQKQ